MKKFKFPKLRFKGFKKLKNIDKKTTLKWLIRSIAIGTALIAFLFIVYAKDLPDPNQLSNRAIPQSTKIYDREGGLLYEVRGEYRRTLIPFSEMNSYVKNSAIAIEDKDFYRESGINLKGILRSVWVNLTSGGKTQGGSTITQQFVRNALLTREKTWSRKIKEIILSLEINKIYSKDDILKLYLNEIPYGRNAYGIEAAAQVYFNKNAKDLDLVEAAYLAALPQAPSYYSPTGPHRDALDNRKNVVLEQMYQQKYITKEQRDEAQKKEVVFERNRDTIKAPHFVQYVIDYLTKKYGEQALQNGGLLVTTTLNPKMQEAGEKAITEGVARNARGANGYNAALVAIDPRSGQILAMVGSKDYFGEPTPAGCKPGLNCTFEPNVNVALAERQAGSSMKPYVYATAFKPEFAQSPASMRVDVLTNFGIFGGKPYIPKNFNGKIHGPVSIRQALAGSLNIPAVKTLALVGVENAVQTMRDAGITSPLKNCGLSLVLGGCEVQLLDHVSGFATFAAMGTHYEKTGILKIENNTGKVLEEYEENKREVLDPQAAYQLISIMTDNASRQFTFGSSSQNLILPGRVVAAKTGTTQNFRDGWAVGFTPSLAAGVWTGNNDGTLMRTDAVITAAPIWKAFMQESLKDTPAEDFVVPPGITRVVVDSLSGKLPGPYTPATKEEIFASYSVPKEIDDTHFAARYEMEPVPEGNPEDPSNNGQGNQPPPEGPSEPTYITGIYTFFRSEKPDDPNWEAPVLAWVYANYGAPPAGSIIVKPGDNPPPAPISNNPPSVNINSPASGSSVDIPFVLQAAITPDTDNRIVRADLLIDGTITQSISGGPFNFTINENLSKGDHTFAVQAVDDKGNTATDSVTLRVK